MTVEELEQLLAQGPQNWPAMVETAYGWVSIRQVVVNTDAEVVSLQPTRSVMLALLANERETLKS